MLRGELGTDEIVTAPKFGPVPVLLKYELNLQDLPTQEVDSTTALRGTFEGVQFL